MARFFKRRRLNKRPTNSAARKNSGGGLMPNANPSIDCAIAHLSHEIRTPMSGIIGMAELLLQTTLTLSQKEMIETLKSSADSLLQFVNGVLDHSKIGAGKLHVEIRPFLLREALSDAMQSLAIHAHKKNLDLICQISGSVPNEVVGDAGRLRQVLVNLIGNAIKFTEQGNVTLSVESDHEKGSHSRIRFSVSDTGIGIPRDRQSQIFEAYAQADSSIAQKYGGTGLGLSISRQIVQLMGGDLSVESQPGVGSVFRFAIELPSVIKATINELQPAMGEAHSPAFETITSHFRIDNDGADPWKLVPWASRRPLRVLLAEDNVVNQRIATRMLERLGHSVRVVGNGQLVLNALEEEEEFDVVLLDIEMPVLDGLLTAEIIRQREQDASRRQHVIAISAYESPEDRRRFSNAGINDAISKPFTFSELSLALHRVPACKQSVRLPLAAIQKKGGCPLATDLNSDVENSGERSRHCLEAEPGFAHESNQRMSERTLCAPFDLNAAKKRLGGDGDFVVELAEIFLDGIHETLTSLKSSINAGDIEAINETAHAIKGPLVSLAAQPSYEAAKMLEIACQDRDIIKIQAKYHDFLTEIDRLNKALDCELL